MPHIHDGMQKTHSICISYCYSIYVYHVLIRIELCVGLYRARNASNGHFIGKLTYDLNSIKHATNGNGRMGAMCICMGQVTVVVKQIWQLHTFLIELTQNRRFSFYLYRVERVQ